MTIENTENFEKIKSMQFPNVGFVMQRIPNDKLREVQDEVNRIRADFSAYQDRRHNDQLAGVIAEEYSLVSSLKALEAIVFPLAVEHNRAFGYLKQFSILDKEFPMGIHNAWVNFQKAGEFNPNHTHSGIYSFVLWLEVPFELKDERLVEPGRYGNGRVVGNFEFSYTNSLGQILNYQMPIDKSFEGHLALFPSKLVHCVYPFYHSAGYRVSISGNIKIRTQPRAPGNITRSTT